MCEVMVGEKVILVVAVRRGDKWKDTGCLTVGEKAVNRSIRQMHQICVSSIIRLKNGRHSWKVVGHDI